MHYFNFTIAVLQMWDAELKSSGAGFGICELRDCSDIMVTVKGDDDKNAYVNITGSQIR